MYKYYEKFINFIFSLQLLKLKLFGAKIGKNIKVYGRFTVVGHPKKLIIEDNVTINEGVFLNCRDYLHIKKNCRLSPYAKIYTAALTLEEIPRKHVQAPTTLEENVWIASNALVNYGITIGKNSVVAGGSVVICDIEENSLYGGIPAKKIKDLKVKP